MKTQYTPGPWRVSTAPEIHQYAPLCIECGDPEAADDSYRRIAVLTDNWEKEWHNNARLIALAPELADALEAVLRIMEHNSPDACAPAIALAKNILSRLA